MAKFGIVQGRLTPSTELQAFPKDWGAEFRIFQGLGYDYIELIAEQEFNDKNPIWEAKMPFMYDCPIVCNDYTINKEMSFLQNKWLIDQCSKWFRTKMIVLPLMGKSENPDLGILNKIADYAAEKDIKIGLETVMNYQDEHPNTSIVYDTGNRSFIKSYLPVDIRKLDKKIGHVHIKDKNEDGENVLLGTGVVNFKEVMQAFKDIGYDGTYTFETTRGKDPIRTAKYNLQFIKFFMEECCT